MRRLFIIIIGIFCLGLSGCSTKSTADHTIVEAESSENEPIQNYTADYQKKVAECIESVSGLSSNQTINYIFLTDLHLDGTKERDDAVYRQLYAAVDIANKGNIDFICIGGDIDDGRFADENGKQTALQLIENVSNILEKSTKPVFIVKGNHDDNSFSAQINPDLLYSADYCISRQEWYSVTMEHFQQYCTDYQNAYYYYDLPDRNARVVVLNMSDNDDTVIDGNRKEIGMYNYQYSDEQIDWLLNKAMSRQDCEYIFLSHDAFDYGTDYGENTNRETVQQILKAAYTHTNMHYGKWEKDFSEWTGQLQLLHHGHLHFERAAISEETGNLPIISTDMARPTKSRSSESGNGKEKEREDLTNSVSEYVDRFIRLGYRRILARDLDTTNEALFDIVVNDRNTIDVIRFGNGENLHIDK